MHELFVKFLGISAESAASFFTRRRQDGQRAHFLAYQLGRFVPQHVRQRLIQAQHAIVRVMHQDKIRDRVEIFHPLLPRLLHPRKEPHILERHGGMSGQRFQQLPFDFRQRPRQIRHAQHTQQLVFAVG